MRSSSFPLSTFLISVFLKSYVLCLLNWWWSHSFDIWNPHSLYLRNPWSLDLKVLHSLHLDISFLLDSLPHLFRSYRRSFFGIEISLDFCMYSLNIHCDDQGLFFGIEISLDFCMYSLNIHCDDQGLCYEQCWDLNYLGFWSRNIFSISLGRAFYVSQPL
jgi:hypothetical protein